MQVELPIGEGAKLSRGDRAVKVIVLGAGLQGCAAAFDLLSTTGAEISLVDRVLPSLPPFLEPHRERIVSNLKPID